MPIKLLFITPIIVFVLWAVLAGANKKEDYDRAERAILAPESHTHIEPCRDLIKAQLENPDSFDEAMFSIKTSHTKDGVVGVSMNFTAKDVNGFPNPQKALCTFGPNDKNEAWIFDAE